MHLGLGGAALASARWTGVAADAILVILGLKLLALTIVAARRRTAKAQPPPRPTR